MLCDAAHSLQDSGLVSILSQFPIGRLEAILCADSSSRRNRVVFGIASVRIGVMRRGVDSHASCPSRVDRSEAGRP